MKPNIVFILSDDHGPWAMGCAGNAEIRTPNLDRLAANGMRFDSFFCASPVCSPARASILTGRIPSQHGVHDWLSGGNMGDEAVEFLQGMVGYTDVLAENGYRCGLSGKWHLGDSVRPQKSFTHWYAHQGGGGPYYNAPMIRDGMPYKEKKYVTEAITDEALDVLDAWVGADEPFYLSVHYTAPHSPWIHNHPQEIVDSYDDCPFDTCPQTEPHPDCNQLTLNVNKNVRENLKGYFAAVTAMDAQIGRILDKVESLGIADNTLVIYMGDNGFSCGQHGFWGKGNGTFPLNMFDHSVKVPAIFSHPGRIPAGLVCRELVSAYDIFPTLIEVAGVDHPCADGLPGTSFLPLLEGRDSAGRENVVVFDEYGPVRMIRNKEWKYVRRYPYGPNELYDLVNDPGELVNLYGSQEHSEVERAMKAELESWFHRYVDPALDGTHEAVTGRGQHSLAGPAGGGVEAFKEAFVRGEG
jgi:arylsulfatase A-like enzyme